jgi:hypothetical protein
MSKAKLVLVSLLLLGSPAIGAEKSSNYTGADAGCVIYAVGTIKIGMQFVFPYKRVASSDGSPVSDWKGEIKPRIGGAFYLKVKNPDFTGEESGHVVIRCLPPGTYEVGGFKFSGFVPGVGSYNWSPAHRMALPFNIESGKATYIGSFMRGPSLGTPLEPVLGAAGYFVVANRAERDLPLAQKRLPAGMVIQSSVTDVTTFGNPALRGSEP